jgi:predicted enzyme related to lactoylglutathione lyase
MIGSSQPKVLAEFYEKVFAKKPDMVEGEWSGWQIGASFIAVGDHSEVAGMAKEPMRVIFNFETKDVKGEFERIKATGATVVKEPYSMGDGAEPSIATFSDPDGNYFQLMAPWDQEEKK